MLFFIITSLLLSLFFITPLITTPITMGLTILLLAILTTALTTITSSPWFALILFIIYIGGMLVIFSYFAAIAPNQKINIPIISSLLLIVFTLISTLIKHIFPNFVSINKTIYPISTTFFIRPNQRSLLIFLALILLLALILVVKIARRNEGPLRPFS